MRKEISAVVATSKTAEFQSINTVKFVGSVVHKYRPRANIITLTLAVGRVGSEQVDYPNITFYGDNAAIIDEALEIRASQYPRVCIDATIQTTRRIIDDRPRYFQNIVGLELRKAPTNMERMTGKMDIGSHKLQSSNEVCLLGEVVNLFEISRPGQEEALGTIVTLKTVDNGKVNFPKVTCFGNIGRAAARLQNGDIACLTGYVQTKYKRRDDEERGVRYETVVGTEVGKV